jgi:hypothetical protein
MTLWNPKETLDLTRKSYIGGHQVVVRRPSMSIVEGAILGAVKEATRIGKPPPKGRVTIHGTWPGTMWSYDQVLSPDWTTLAMYEATRIANHKSGALEGFRDDAKKLPEGVRARVLPVLLVTDLSATARFKSADRLEVDEGFYDPRGPDKTQDRALHDGICVLRTTQEELPRLMPEVMQAIHLGERHPNLIIP